MKKDSREILEALVKRDTYRSMYSKLNNPDRLAIAEMLQENERLREALEEISKRMPIRNYDELGARINEKRINEIIETSKQALGESE